MNQIVLADIMDYTSSPFTVTHPDRLAVLARLAGMDPAPVDRCSVFEAGCGEGTNLISMAYTLPNSEFLGVDLGKKPIAKAKESTKALNLKNLEFYCENLLEYDPGDVQFDYMIAHGFFSWVPPVVQDKLLSLIQKHLAPNGVAYISYNCFPGAYSTLRLRELALFHLECCAKREPERFADPLERTKETIALIRKLADSVPNGAVPSRSDVYAEAFLWTQRSPVLVFHDLIGDCWMPFNFREFLDRAAGYGLQFLNDASPAEPDAPKIGEDLRKHLREICAGDRVAERQYFDHLIGRRFRQTLLVRAEHQLSRDDLPSVVPALYVDSMAVEKIPASGEGVLFDIPDYAQAETNNPAIIDMMRRVIAKWPERVTFQELAAGGMPEDDLSQLIRTLYRGGVIGLYTQPSPAGGAGERPRASAYARYEAPKETFLNCLLHRPIEFQDEDARWFIGLLDGTRDRAALLDELLVRFPDKPLEDLQVQMTARLEDLQRLGMLHPAA